MDDLRLDRLTSPQAGEAAARGAVVILPIGAVEAHGPHLPLGTDTVQAEAVALEAARIAGALVAPPLPYGACVSTRDHPGTISVGTAALRALVADVIGSLARQGFRAVLILSGHAGSTHVMALRDIAEELAAKDPSLRLAVVSEYDLAARLGGDILTTPDDRHAGELETSRMLHLAPGTVRGSAPAEYPSFPPHLVTTDKRSFWPGSVWGDPGKADAAKGAALLARSADAVAAVARALAAATGRG